MTDSDVVKVYPRTPQVVQVDGFMRGEAATIAIGEVTDGEPGEPGEVTNSGTPNDAVLDFVLPVAVRTKNVDGGTPYTTYGGIEEDMDGGGP